MYLLSDQYLFPGKSSLQAMLNYINVYRLAQALLHCSVTPHRHVLKGLVSLSSNFCTRMSNEDPIFSTSIVCRTIKGADIFITATAYQRISKLDKFGCIKRNWQDQRGGLSVTLSRHFSGQINSRNFKSV